jgi:hypothetical protein
LAENENTTHNGDDNEELVLSLTMISSPSKARNNNNRSRYILVVSDRCMRVLPSIHENVSALLSSVFPVLFYFSTSSVPDAVLPVVGDALSVTVSVSEASSATAISETPKKKHERPEDLSSDNGIIYSHARFDRTGAAFQDMLMAHAYAWHRNFTYHGACISSDHPAPHADQLQELLQATGLNAILKFACPDTKRGGRIRAKAYYRKDTAIGRQIGATIFDHS